MAAPAGKTASRLAALAAAAALIGLASARILTLGVGTPGYATGILASLAGGGLASVLASPLAIAWDDPVVLAGGASSAGAILLLAAATAVRGQRHNIDTDAAHGDARLARKGEMSDLMDERHAMNNIMFSQHVGIVLDATTPALRRRQYAKNLNTITLGISGLGKTYNCVIPDLLQSVGAALRPEAPGLLAAASGARRRVDPRGWERSQARKDAAWERRRAALAREGLGGGYDVVHSDPKGDNLRDCGQMYLDAGYEVSVINTVDFKASHRYNPLAAIPPRWVDVCDLEDVPFALPTVSVDGRPLEPSAPAGPVEAPSDGPTVVEQSLGPVSVTFALYPSVEERSAADMLRQGSADGSPDASLPPEVADFSFRRTRAVLRIAVANRAPAEVPSVRVGFALDRRIDWLMPDYEAVSSAPEPFRASNGGDARDSEFAWEIDLPAAGEDGPSVSWLEMPIEVKAMCVPDPVALAKVVNALTKNLGAKHDPNGKAEDPFWENCKKLHFMSKISYLFERYYPSSGYRYVTIPCMVDMIDEDMPDSGDPSDPSCTSERMEGWEYGHIWRSDPPAGGASQGERPEPGDAVSGDWEPLDSLPHKRDRSLAVKCYRALANSAADTYRSVVISTYAACVDIMGQDVREMLSCDEVHLDRLGEPGRGHAVFLIFQDTENPFEFIAALVMQQAIDSCMERAFSRHGGRLPRHVRFILDEAANLGMVPCLVRALAVVRSRNVSISLYLQSKSQLQERYGEKNAQSIFDCCSTMCFLGAQSEETLEMVSKKIGDETVFTQVLQHSFKGSSLFADSSESLSASARRVRTPSQLQQLDTGSMLVFIYNHLPCEDAKQDPTAHPLFRFVLPDFARSLRMPPAAHAGRLDVREFVEGTRDGPAQPAVGAPAHLPTEHEPPPQRASRRR